MSPLRKRPYKGGQPFPRASLGVDTSPTLVSVTPNADRVAGGVAVTLRGTNFRLSDTGELPEVWFNNPATSYSVRALDVILVDSLTLTFSAPPGDFTGLYDIELRIPDANSFKTAFLYGSFTYASSAIGSVTPPYGPLAGGTTVLIFGYNFVAGSTITFGGQPATSVLFIDSQHYSAVTPNHALGAVDVVITEPGLSTSTLRSGFQYTLLTRANDIRRQPGVTVNDQLNNSPNQCSFTVDGQSNRPTVGEKIEIIDSADADRLLFAGSAQRIEQIYEELTDQLAWRVECVDWTWLLNRRRPFGTYTNVSASEVAIDLITRYAPGFTYAHVQTNLANVTVEFDGSQDLGSCLSIIAAMIGGGHWYIDYVMDLHFFHVVSENLSLGPIPPPVIISVVGTPMTVVEGVGIPSTFRFNPGYYFFRHTFVYSDGTESEFQACSNVLYLTGANILEFSNIPLGAAIGPLTCVKRRIYYNEMLSLKYGGGRALTDVLKFVEINDNVTTAYTTWFSVTGISDPLITVIPATTPVPVKAFTGHPVGPASSLTTVININSGSAYYNGGRFQFRVANLYRDGTVSYAGVASSTVTKWLKKNEGVRSFTFSVIPLGVTINGVDVIARLIYMSTGGFADMPYQTGTDAWWADYKTSADGDYDEEGSDGKWRRSGMGGEPDWSPANTKGVWVVPDNETTDIISAVMGNPAGGSAGKSFAQVLAELQASHAAGTLYSVYGSRIGYNDALTLQGMGSVPTTQASLGNVIGHGDLRALMAPAVASEAVGWPLVGFANAPYWSVGQLSEDPLPNWPNNDGPSLELDEPPDAIDSSNTLLLQNPPFTSSVDLSQVRNRIFVIGSGSSLVVAGAVGDLRLQVADITQFSPSGGTVKSGKVLGYTGVTGTVEQAYITLTSALDSPLKQGAIINNFLEANHLVSQQLLGRIELDSNGAPTDGVHEYTIVNGSFKAPFQLWMAAQAELELFAMPIVTINYATRDPKSRSGAMVHVDLDDPPCQGDFLIQTVTIDQIHDESDELIPRRTVTACSVRYELNDLLLQILKNNTTSGGASLVGVVPAAMTATLGATTTGVTFRKGGEAFAMFSPPSTGSVISIPTNLTPFSGGVAGVPAGTGKIDVRGTWFTNRIATVAGANGYGLGGPRLASLLQLPKVTWRVLTSTIADAFDAYGQYVCALADRPGSWLGSTEPESGIYVLRDSGNWPLFTGGSRTNWQIQIVEEGGVKSTTIGPEIRPDTVYIIIIEALSPTSVRVSINDWAMEFGNLNITDYLSPCGTVQHYSNDPLPNIGLWISHILWESN